MASGARVGKIYPLDEADVSCLDLFILCCYVSFATVDKSSYCGHGQLGKCKASKNYYWEDNRAGVSI